MNHTNTYFQNNKINLRCDRITWIFRISLDARFSISHGYYCLYVNWKQCDIHQLENKKKRKKNNNTNPIEYSSSMFVHQYINGAAVWYMLQAFILLVIDVCFVYLSAIDLAGRIGLNQSHTKSKACFFFISQIYWDGDTQ